MSNNFIFSRTLKLLLIGIFLLPLLNIQLKADYCTASTASKSEFICEVYFNEIANTDCFQQQDISDYTYMSTTVIKNETYFIEVYNGNDWYNDRVSVWIDYNHDEIFDTKTEELELTLNDEDGHYFSGYITIPSSASNGATRLRVRMTDTETPNPCGKQNWGEIEDYTVNIIPPPPDGMISGLQSPVKPFLAGEYPVVAKFNSEGKTKISNAKIDWYVNNIFQGTYNYTGSLAQFQSVDLTFGNYNFSYPDNEVNFNPFKIRFVVRDVNGENPDGNPDNDVFQITTTPTLYDCGAIGFFGPPEGFGAGTTQVRARVMNYAPKPLKSIIVNWKVDGVVQTPKTFTGLNVKKNEFIDLNMGTFYFYNKTPLGPFNVEVWTEKPNGIADENATNDKYAGGIGPSLSAGTYFAGGANAHFATPAEAASYLNSSGVFGQGTVIVEIRPGSYNGQIILNNALANNNQVIFRSSTGFGSDVTLYNNPSSANNFVLQLANISNVKFENLIIRNNNSNISNAGRLIEVQNVNGLTFNKVLLYGIANSPKIPAYNIMTVNNANNVSITGCDFNDGSVGIWNNSVSTPLMNLTGNNFTNFSQYGIYNNINTQGSINVVSIFDNNFKNISTLRPNGAVYSMNGTVLENNLFNDIKGSGSMDDAIIKIVNSSPDANNPVRILNNIITNCSDINGVMVNNAYAFINLNKFVMTQSLNFGCAMLNISGSLGNIGNNTLTGSGIMAVNINDSPDLNFVYNTVSAEMNNRAIILVNGTPANILRNIFINKGDGQALMTSSAVNIDQNILHTEGSSLASINSNIYSDITGIHNAGMMLRTYEYAVEFFSPSDPHLKIYNASLIFDTPLYSQKSNIDGWTIEATDFDGESRVSYYAGSDEIFLSVAIERQSDGFVDCVGTDYNLLTVSSAIGYNAPLTYQWYMDGQPIGGATEPVLYFKNLQHKQAGLYKCLVKGPGVTTPVFSKEVAVYVVRPTEITREPESQMAIVGSTVTLSVEAHVNGIDLETALANETVKVQWYKTVTEGDEIVLLNNQFISGATSNYLTIKNFQAGDKGDYYAEVIGLCSRVKSKKAHLDKELIDLIIESVPTDASVCEGNTAVFKVAAKTNSNKTITYQWTKDGNPIYDIQAKITGVHTNTLTILNVQNQDKGEYSVIVGLTDTQLSENPSANLNVLKSPVIMTQPQNVSVETGKSFELNVVAQGSGGAEIMTYKWFKDGTLIQTTNEGLYTVEAANQDDAGQYYVEVANACSTATSIVVTVTVTTGTVSGVYEVSQNGYSLSTAVPNPVIGNSVINFTVPNDSYIKITLTDMSGAGKVVLAEGNYGTGTYKVNLDAKGNNLVSGTYFYIMESGGIHLSQKLIVIR